MIRNTHIGRQSLLGILLVLCGPAAMAQIAANGSLTQLNPCLASLPLIAGASELVGCNLKFNANGEITFSFKNRGSVGINTSPVIFGATKPKKEAQPAGPKIQIDVYLQGNRIESVYHAALGPGQTKEITVKIPSNYQSQVPKCGDVRALKVVLDPLKQIPESSDGDNVIERPAADRPCPDMAIESIKKNSNSLHTEYVAEVRLVNKGNANARFRYLATTGSNSAVAPLPDLDYDIVMELEPGQSKKFTVGSALGLNRLHVMVLLDRMGEVAELNEGNNYAEKMLD
jgi:hypothetical protein